MNNIPTWLWILAHCLSATALAWLAALWIDRRNRGPVKSGETWRRLVPNKTAVPAVARRRREDLKALISSAGVVNPDCLGRFALQNATSCHPDSDYFRALQNCAQQNNTDNYAQYANQSALDMKRRIAAQISGGPK